MTKPYLHNVLLVGPKAPPLGGMSLQALQLYKHLKQEGFNITFLPVNIGLPRIIAKIQYLRAVIRFIYLLNGLVRHLPKSTTVHLMANSGLSWYLHAAPVLILARFWKVPVVLNYRGGNARPFFQKHIKRIRSQLERADMVVVPSLFLSKIFADFGFESIVIPNIVDTTCFTPCEKPTNPIICLAARNLEKIYGMDIAIRALSEARKTYPYFKLIIAGVGSERGDLERLCHLLGLQDHVQFVGRVPRSKMANLFHEATLLLNPVRVDNMPNALLEALASGVPIISSDVGGIPYMVRHKETAYLVEKDDVNAFAEAMVILGRDKPLREHLIKNGLKQVQQYTWAHVRDQWLDVYHKVGHHA